MTQKRKRTASTPSCCASLDSILSPRLFKALCDPNRLAILSRLAGSCTSRTVSQVAECCPINISVVSRHLAQLRDAGILQAERCGKEVRYSVRVQELVRTLREIADALERCCPAPTVSREKPRSGRRAAEEGAP